ncbi:MAG: hypothetical protein KGM47_08395 [Acidobacteriota bacterium]|nr:hypothetical protein [Acidobacteriota bacterium]
MTLTSPGSTLTGTNVLAGVYVGAYEATINGVPTPVICDDYSDESYVPESWTANSSAFSDLSSTKWAAAYPANYGALYNEAAWLIEQMINPVNSSQLGEIQYAIWGLFNHSAITDLTSYNAQDGAIAQGWLNNAQGQAPSDSSSFTVYTPFIPPAPTCYSGAGQAVQCASSPPQEFITYNASEPPFLAMLGADLLLLGLAIGFLRRRAVLKFVR